jgi:hypothetical protein
MLELPPTLAGGSSAKTLVFLVSNARKLTLEIFE